MQSLWSFSALCKVMNGVRLTVGQIHSPGVTHSVVLMTYLCPLKVPRWRRWASTIGEVNNVDVPAMVRAVRVANKNHVQQALDTIIDLLEAEEAESVQIDDVYRRGSGSEGGQNNVVCGDRANKET